MTGDTAARLLFPFSNTQQVRCMWCLNLLPYLIHGISIHDTLCVLEGAGDTATIVSVTTAHPNDWNGVKKAGLVCQWGGWGWRWWHAHLPLLCLLSHVCSPVVLDLIVCAPWQPPCYPRPPVPPPSMELNDNALFLWWHAAMLEARVKIVHPAQAAALSCPVEA